jgi:hypothetical protein
MQDADAHYRRKRRRSASVTRSAATSPRGGCSASSSDDDAGAADNGDYYEERSWHTEATVGDIFQGDLASKTQANAQDIQIAGIAVVQPRV